MDNIPFVLGFTLIFFYILFVIFSLLINYAILKKIGYDKPYLGLIPFICNIPFIDLAKHNRLCILLLFIPWVNLVYSILIMQEPMRRLNGSLLIYTICTLLVVPTPFYLLYLLAKSPTNIVEKS